MRVLHIGKYYPPYQGGMENFLGDILVSSKKASINAAALVHQHLPGPNPVFDKHGDVPVWRAPTRGQILYVPVCPSFPYYLHEAVKAFQPDLMHFHLPNTSAFWALFNPAVRSIPWIIHWHSDVVSSAIDQRLKWAYLLYRPFEQAMLKNAEAVIATSQPYLAGSKGLERWHSKCHVIPLGVDPGRLPPSEAAACDKAKDSWKKGTMKVLAVGRLTYYKGFEVLIKAAKKVQNISVQIVGEGVLGETLKQTILQKGLQDRVILRGSLPDPELRALLSACDCFCLPSIERTEAFGLVLLEAMRYGRAIVASDIPGSGVGWVVRKGACGYLFPPGDVSALALILAQLSEGSNRRRELGKKGQEAFKKEFNIDSVTQEIRALYQNSIKDMGINSL